MLLFFIFLLFFGIYLFFNCLLPEPLTLCWRSQLLIFCSYVLCVLMSLFAIARSCLRFNNNEHVLALSATRILMPYALTLTHTERITFLPAVSLELLALQLAVALYKISIFILCFLCHVQTLQNY